MAKYAVLPASPAQGRPSTEFARRFVADYFDAINRQDLSQLVREGKGDDFEEVRAADALLSQQADRVARYETALSQYADPGFWDDTLPGGALAFHDGGEMAANVLAGKPAFFHRD
ncbi:hypothetical protein [Novosphingobium pentaromativorans]|uniref:Uncharacterized protein n=1 Tax=Novosphingobium pentaromativorans US6-1 TaxID=1088721 RepID=G6EH84_9SPHN|nr:hypothetical protein [Novosphingobium pentaromativorans]EHJ59373.1 hypothetical protein NSU_3705 [Novosphingobium pentaromativorans US6-1]